VTPRPIAPLAAVELGEALPLPDLVALALELETLVMLALEPEAVPVAEAVPEAEPVAPTMGAVLAPSICAWTEALNVPVMAERVNLDEKASAGYWGSAASLRESDSKRTKLWVWASECQSRVWKRGVHALFRAVRPDGGVRSEDDGLCGGDVDAVRNGLEKRLLLGVAGVDGDLAETVVLCGRGDGVVLPGDGLLGASLPLGGCYRSSRL
jgi:hypothetical protein